MDKELELDLIQKIKNGNYQLFERFIEEYQNTLFSFLFRMLKNSDDARDICQDTFFKAYRSIRSYDGRAKFSTWLYKIGYYQAINFIRRKKKHSEILKKMKPETVPDKKGKDLEMKEIGTIIEHITSDIHHNYRVALHLFYKEEKSYNEIASIMKIPLNSVKSLIFRAKELIRNKLINDYQFQNHMN